VGEHAANGCLVQIGAHVRVEHRDHRLDGRRPATELREHLFLALDADGEIRDGERLGRGDRVAVRRPQHLVVASGDLAERVHVRTHVAIRWRDDCGAPPHHVVAGKQGALWIKSEL
jgi:hypothetical protein